MVGSIYIGKLLRANLKNSHNLWVGRSAPWRARQLQLPPLDSARLVGSDLGLPGGNQHSQVDDVTVKNTARPLLGPALEATVVAVVAGTADGEVVATFVDGHVNPGELKLGFSENSILAIQCYFSDWGNRSYCFSENSILAIQCYFSDWGGRSCCFSENCVIWIQSQLNEDSTHRYFDNNSLLSLSEYLWNGINIRGLQWKSNFR